MYIYLIKPAFIESVLQDRMRRLRKGSCALVDDEADCAEPVVNGRGDHGGWGDCDDDETLGGFIVMEGDEVEAEMETQSGTDDTHTHKKQKRERRHKRHKRHKREKQQKHRSSKSQEIARLHVTIKNLELEVAQLRARMCKVSKQSALDRRHAKRALRKLATSSTSSAL